ncbi:MAG: ATP synthase F1 subunit delta, partial [Flavobacteriaceae bacterium]
SVKLFSLLADNNRLSILGETGKQYLDLYTKNQGEVKAIVTSAVPLSSALEKEVLEKAKNFSQQKVHIENKIDPNIMGGFILKIGDMQYDASVVHQLKAIKTTLTKTNTI